VRGPEIVWAASSTTGKPVIRPLVNLFRLAGSHVPTRSRAALARRLLTRANAERDAQNYQAAVPLYEEALRLTPNNPRFLMQYGHMLKEAGDYASAEHHYGRAAEMLPQDPDVALQLGYFYKVAGRPHEAFGAYRRAAMLRPGWLEAEREAASVANPQEADASSAAGAEQQMLSQLLPRATPPAGATMREGFFMRRLGAARVHQRGGHRRALRGVEAIHGFVISKDEVETLTLLVDGAEIRRDALTASLHLSGGQAKYVFNIWHDFSALEVGPKLVELRASRRRGGDLVHRAIVEIAPPVSEEAFATSDVIVDPPRRPDLELDEYINTRPSMIRPALRGLLPEGPKTILVQRADQLGDLVCSLPALDRLHALYPEARLVALVTPANADLARTVDLLDDVVVVDFAEHPDGRKVLSGPAQQELRQTLGAFDFDMAIDLAETSESRPLLLLSGARILYGFKDREFPWLTVGFELNTHDPANHNATAATAQKLVAMVDALGELTGQAPYISRREDLDRARLAAFGIGGGDAYAVLHTGARLAYSRWPGFSELASLLIENTNLKIIVMGDEPLGSFRQSPRITTISERLAFDDFDTLLSFAAVFVGNDSGPKHLASLRGVPVASLHMARLNWNEWGQTATGVIISRRVPCAGCGIAQDAEDCGKAFACLRQITPAEVFGAVQRLLPPPLQSRAG